MKFINQICLLVALICDTNAYQDLVRPPATVEAFDGGFNLSMNTGDYTSQTSYKFNGCNAKQQGLLTDATVDAVFVASQALDIITVPGSGSAVFVNFNTRAAIEYFGPDTKHDSHLRLRIITTLERASQAYPGWGIDDWWSDRYVVLSCVDVGEAKDCSKGKYVAYTSNGYQGFGYPVIVFCSSYFTELPTHRDMMAKLDANQSQEQVNGYNLRSQASTMLHEWLHMNWSVAEVCPGGAIDQRLRIGDLYSPDTVRAYRPGKAKLLAKLDVEKAASNNDNYVWFALTRMMNRRYTTHPVYPLAWDISKTESQNYARDRAQPGAPPKFSSLDDDPEDDADGSDADAPAINGSLYPITDYPDWYQPLIAFEQDPATSGEAPEITPPPTDAALPPGFTVPPPVTATQGVPQGWGPINGPLPPLESDSPPPPPAQPSPTPAPPAGDICGDWYKFVLDHFEIYGKNFDADKFGKDGSGLKDQLSGCGAITDWSFEYRTNDPNGYQWFAQGNMPIGTKACVGRAVVSAGGSSPDGCTGAG